MSVAVAVYEVMGELPDGPGVTFTIRLPLPPVTESMVGAPGAAPVTETVTGRMAAGPTPLAAESVTGNFPDSVGVPVSTPDSDNLIPAGRNPAWRPTVGVGTPPRVKANWYWTPSVAAGGVPE